MAFTDTQLADKNIVDRRQPHRNTDVAKAIRRTRERLSQRDGNPAFERELLQLHARGMINTAAAIPLMVLVVTAGGLFLGSGSQILIWAGITGACYLGLAIIAHRAARSETNDLDAVGLRRTFLLGHFVSGLGWAYLTTVECSNCQVDQFGVLKALMLLLAIASTALMTHTLKGALLATFAVPIAAFAWSAIGQSNAVEAIMIGLLAVSLGLFTFVASDMNRSAVMLLSYQTEKDELIGELETAKSMSDEARRRAEDANLAKSRFLATMSHELRTPLNAILGFSEVMGNEVLGPIQNETYRDYARDINASGQHLLNLINEILDLSRIEAGRYQLNEEPLSLAGVVEECCHLMELKAHKKSIRLVQQFEPSLPRLLADERSLRQVTLNLLSNAIKFAPNGTEVRVRVGWTAGGGQYFSVKDNGPGIPADEIPIVLSAFGQGSIAIKSAEQGTGLGLPIVQGLLSLHGGEFQLRSKLREGTEAIAILPAARVMEVLPAILPKRATGGR